MSERKTATEWSNRTYIGDGVYASFDGYQIWLETERWDENECVSVTHRIALEPEVFYALYEYGRSLGFNHKVFSQ